MTGLFEKSFYRLDIEDMKHVFIIGSKGIPAEYGGFETFVQELVTRKQTGKIEYHVACCRLVKGQQKAMIEETYWHDVHCFHVPVRDIGNAKAVLYDIKALQYCTTYIRRQKYREAVVYVLASRIGPFIGYYKSKLNALGALLYVNPDGHEWKREKWNALIKCYWRISEHGMIKNADRVICDSLEIQKYINRKYQSENLRTCFIPYGAYTAEYSDKTDNGMKINVEEAVQWLQERKIEPGQFYLVVGRFVPENNYECILKEFIKSDTKRKLLLITDTGNTGFYKELEKKTDFTRDERICFGGTLYKRELLTAVRMLAFAYIHGHSVGGTNPSLLESMGTTDINLLFDVPYNREVGQEAAAYWTKKENSLSNLMKKAESLSEDQRKKLGAVAKNRIRTKYSWPQVVSRYEQLFMMNDID